MLSLVRRAQRPLVLWPAAQSLLARRLSRVGHAAAHGAAVAAIATLLGACDPLASFEPQIITDDQLFALQAQDVDNATATVKYEWKNTQAQARVHHATMTTGAGSASLRILDAAGALVYSSALLPTGSASTSPGVPGTWHIEITMTGYSGTLGFHILAGSS